MKLIAQLFIIASVAIATQSCKNTLEITPIGETRMIKADIGEGKVVFMENCIDCHYGRSVDRVPEIVSRYTKEQWEELLPRMVVKADLSEDKSRQVAAYIAWELEN